MPTPVGHLLAGAIVHKSQKTQKGMLFFLLVLLFAFLPDFDFVFGLAAGDANRYHHLFTHSFFFVIAAGVLGGALYAKWARSSFVKSSAIFASAGISHVILDILALDQREPLGCPIWWPFSNEFVISPVLVFSDVSRASDSHVFFQSLFNLHNLKTVLIEIAVLAPLLLVVFLVQSKVRLKSKSA
jgi:membrane-bound metal-dependent hydrolase YbcI (DUF457 family)